MKDILNNAWDNKFLFLGTFFVVFSIFYIFLTAIDFLPEEPDSDEEASESAMTNNVEAENSITETDETEAETEANLRATASIGEVVEDNAGLVSSSNSNSVQNSDSANESYSSERIMPIEISFPKLDRTVPVLNPTSRTIADLDAALLNGAVRHPDSATLGQNGNVFILGHSSYLPQVFNDNFQAFNGIQELVWGDIIEVVADGRVFEYRVDKVYRANASSLTVPIADTGKMLTLATCNSFGSVDDRYIVEAKQISSRAL